MKKGLLKLVAFSVLVVTLASCAKAPQAEIDAANVAIEAAKTAGADRYVPESFNVLVKELQTLCLNIEYIQDAQDEIGELPSNPEALLPTYA